MLSLPTIIFSVRAQSTYEPYVFSTLAGRSGYGTTDGSGSGAQFRAPSGVAADAAGNVYVADSANHTIRRMTPSGVVTTFAGVPAQTGSRDGAKSVARFNNPTGVAVDGAGSVYVADTWNHTIRKITPEGVVTTLAGSASTSEFGFPAGGYLDGIGTAARFNNPSGLALDTSGNIYVADSFNHVIRKVTSSNVVTTFSGCGGSPGSADGAAATARFNVPSGIAVDLAGNLYVADSGNFTIRKVTSLGRVTTLAGHAGSAGTADATGNRAQFGSPFEPTLSPTGLAIDIEGNIYVADTASHTLRKVTSSGVVTTLAGAATKNDIADGLGSVARFSYPCGIAVDGATNVLVADTHNHTIRKVTPSGLVTTLAGMAGSSGSTDGIGSAARFGARLNPDTGPAGGAMDSTGNLYVADNGNKTIRKITPEGVVTTLAGTAGSVGTTDGNGAAARFGFPVAVATDIGNNVYVADAGNNSIRKITAVGEVTTLRAGNFNIPQGVAVDRHGNIYVANTGDQTIRKITLDGVVMTLAGRSGSPGSADGQGSVARFDSPYGLSVDIVGDIYVADYGNHTIRKVTPTGLVTTLAGLAGTIGNRDGAGSRARFAYPTAVATDLATNLYVTDTGNNTIRKITPAGIVTTLAGMAGAVGNSTDGTGGEARFFTPWGVAVDDSGNIYVADSFNHTIRRGFPVPRLLTASPGFGFNNGQFGFNLAGPSGKGVVIETSEDLSNWLPVWTNLFTGTLDFRDHEFTGASSRFYRARLE